MIAWRLCKRKYATRELLLNGAGAKTVGGRWNRPGLAVVYASASSSLALLETLVHAEADTLPASIVAAQIIIPDDVTRREVALRDLSGDWQTLDNEYCVELGSAWIESKTSLVLQVPSAVNPLESNMLINPSHAEIDRCEIGEIVAVTYDRRLLEVFRSR